jgi:hypothetical protein
LNNLKHKIFSDYGLSAVGEAESLFVTQLCDGGNIK